MRVAEGFPEARQQALTGHPLAQYVRSDLSAAVSDALGELSRGLVTEGSPGVGNWAVVPWAAIFDPLVTDTATKGYYVVFLFAHGKSEVHLSLNQGTTAVVSEYGRIAHQVLRDRAALIRARVPDFVDQFETYELELGSDGRLPRGYEAAHAFGRRYRTDALPPEAALRSDLQTLTRAYLALTFRGGLDPTPELGSGGQAEHQDERPGTSLVERRRYRLHRRIERHPSASREAKRHHGLTCQGCGFRFIQLYGELGDGFIEAHHLRPLSDLQEGVPVRYDVATDFAVLCSNCHRMIHRTEDPSDIAAFRELVALHTVAR